MEEYKVAAENIKPLYQKALNYLKEANIPDLEKECAYQPWDEVTTARVNNWLSLVLDMKDPKVTSVNEVETTYTPEVVETVAQEAVEDPFANVASEDNNLPF